MKNIDFLNFIPLIPSFLCTVRQKTQWKYKWGLLRKKNDYSVSFHQIPFPIKILLVSRLSPQCTNAVSLFISGRNQSRRQWEDAASVLNVSDISGRYTVPQPLPRFQNYNYHWNNSPIPIQQFLLTIIRSTIGIF